MKGNADCHTSNETYRENYDIIFNRDNLRREDDPSGGVNSLATSDGESVQEDEDV